MGLHEFLQVLKRYRVSIIAVFFTALVVGVGVTLLQKPVYKSSASVLVSLDSDVSSSGLTYLEQQTASFAEIANTAVVLEPVKEQLGLDMTTAELSGKITSTVKKNTSMIIIEVEDGIPGRSAAIANATADSLVRSFDSLTPSRGEGGKIVTAQVVDRALASSKPISPRPIFNMAIAAVLGGLLGIGQASLREKLNNKIRNAEDIEGLIRTPVLGVIGQLSKDPVGSKFFDDTTEQWANQEAYRRIRTRVIFSTTSGDHSSSIVVTSATPGEGTTTTTINLAWALAQASKSVLLVDANLRHPQIAQQLEINAPLGLSDVLIGRGEISEFAMPVSARPGTLTLLSAGSIPTNPSELLGSNEMKRFIRAAEKAFDHVLFDTSPILPVTDAAVLAALTGEALLVVRAKHAKGSQIQEACGLLEAGSVRILGTVLNDISEITSTTTMNTTRTTRRQRNYQQRTKQDQTTSRQNKSPRRARSVRTIEPRPSP